MQVSKQFKVIGRNSNRIVSAKAALSLSTLFNPLMNYKADQHVSLLLRSGRVAQDWNYLHTLQPLTDPADLALKPQGAKICVFF